MESYLVYARTYDGNTSIQLARLSSTGSRHVKRSEWRKSTVSSWECTEQIVCGMIYLLPLDGGVIQLGERKRTAADLIQIVVLALG